jgi:CDP-glycerol glycerophosphotransferase (TagB/SpsB family)
MSMFTFLRKSSIAAAGLLFVTPLTFFFPRDMRHVVVIGRDGGRFTDNAKYFYIALHDNPGLRPMFLGTPDAAHALNSLGAAATPAAGLRALWACLRAGTVVIDNIDWGESMRYAACRGARIVQLWHGMPLKEIELAVLRKNLRRRSSIMRLLWRMYNWLTGRYAKTDVLLCTSEQVRSVFMMCFHATRLSTAGYPRNDVLLDAELRMHPLARVGVDAGVSDRISEHHARHGNRVALYAPTFRKDLADPLHVGAFDIESLSRVADSLGLLLLVKLHPWMHANSQNVELPGIVMLLPETDIYPLMSDVDFLITDFSSIFFDYLLLNRPVLFYPYDYDSYVRDERDLLYDYATMTPGPKAYNLKELIEEIGRAVRGEDEFGNDRERVRRLVFDYADGRAATRLLSELFH